MNFYSENINDSEIIIGDDQVHHFKNVSRGKAGDEVLVFDGKGSIASGIVSELKKKELTIAVESIKTAEPTSSLNLILCVPKKEYVESVFRSATQMGIKKMYLIHTKFSPWKFSDTPRLRKILVSSMIQSENPFLPEIEVMQGLEAINEIEGVKVAFLTEIPSADVSEISEATSFIIGPEGGFHEEEIKFLESSDSVKCMRLPTPIMKAETAAVYANGFLAAMTLHK